MATTSSADTTLSPAKFSDQDADDNSAATGYRADGDVDPQG